MNDNNESPAESIRQLYFNGPTEDLLTREIERLRVEVVILLSQIDELDRVSRIQTQAITELDARLDDFTMRLARYTDGPCLRIL